MGHFENMFKELDTTLNGTLQLTINKQYSNNDEQQCANNLEKESGKLEEALVTIKDIDVLLCNYTNLSKETDSLNE